VVTTNALELAVLGGLFAEEIRAKLQDYVLTDNDCMLFRGFKAGYRTICSHGLVAKAHRLAWTLERGEIPDFMTLDHRVVCRTTCINVNHMEVVTLRVNIQRGNARRFPRVFA